jgi:hypothetical protein
MDTRIATPHYGVAVRSNLAECCLCVTHRLLEALAAGYELLATELEQGLRPRANRSGP